MKLHEKKKHISDLLGEIEKDTVLSFENPLEAYKVFVLIEKQIKAAKECIFESAIDEVEKYEKAELTEMGITYKSGSPIYDYSGIKAWQEYKEKIKTIEENALKAFKASHGNNVEIINTTDGATVDMPTIKSYRKSSIIFK